MGQYWQVVSPDQQQQLTTLVWGKLGCILPGGYAGHYLQQQLMVPKRKQMNLLSKAQGQKETKGDMTIVSKLRKYLAKLKAEEGEGDTSEDNITQTEEDTAPADEDIPSLLYDIYSSTWLLGCKISLGEYITKKDIPALVELFFDNLLGGWANERILCVGDYSDSVPPEYPSSESTRLYNYNYEEVLSLSDCAEQFLKLLNAEEAFRTAYSKTFEESFPSGEQHVLLNLTTREYVLGKSEFSGKELEKDRDKNTWGLGDAAMSRIVWSQDESTSMKYYVKDFEKGQWAGHRFAIVSASAFDEITGGREGWKDVSDEVNEVLSEIWIAEGYDIEEARAKRAAKEEATAGKGKHGQKRKSPAPETGAPEPKAKVARMI